MPAESPGDAPPPGWRLQIADSLPSTSDLLLRLAAAGEPEGLAVLARQQTAARGRDGRAWRSPPGNLCLSLLLRPEVPARDAPIWALLFALALAEAIEPWIPDPRALRLKWPNDLMLGGAKLAGMLCESAARQDGRLDWLVAGLGANLAVAPHLPDRPTACLAAFGPPPSPESVAASVLRSVDKWRARLAAEGAAPVIAAWMHRGPAPQEMLTVRTGTSETAGRYKGLDRDGALLLETPGGVRRFASGEICAGRN